ncbi:DUF1428 family protein [Ureibacillus manganicus]|uniref:Uncharacterized protein n=1 Tax=Ureibacillus manganicus DSM 26584 TaxID=1384049 RepID=A0A0A3HZH1_9BACL|nr:DUF1428 family protein [Ureibacillus manganicus]KGR77991.1 hypothetical protein CD29_12590 [Ureibacillus manganicus DSM 26584]
MYKVLYLYPVLKQKKDRFIEINKKASLIYKEYGAIEDDTFQSTLIDAMYGCKGMEASVELHDDETLMCSVSTFSNKQHHDIVMEKVDSDLRIEELYNEMIKLIDMSRVVRGEFEKV